MASTFDQSSRKSGCESSDVLAGWAPGWVVRVGPHTNAPQGTVCTDTLPPGCGPQTYPVPVGRTLRGAPVFPTSSFPCSRTSAFSWWSSAHLPSSAASLPTAGHEQAQRSSSLVHFTFRSRAVGALRRREEGSQSRQTNRTYTSRLPMALESALSSHLLHSRTSGVTKTGGHLGTPAKTMHEDRTLLLRLCLLPIKTLKTLFFPLPLWRCLCMFPGRQLLCSEGVVCGCGCGLISSLSLLSVISQALGGVGVVDERCCVVSGFRRMGWLLQDVSR